MAAWEVADKLNRTTTILTLLLLIPACSSSLVRHRPGSRDPSRPAQYGVATGDQLSTTASGNRSALSTQSPNGIEGTLKITIKDLNGHHPSGIPIQVFGPINRVFTSDSDGTIEVMGSQGYYDFQVMTGCTETIQVLQGNRGHGYIVAGKSAEGSLATEWRHRFSPGGGSYPSSAPFWEIGKTEEFTFDVIDRCLEERAPESDLATWKIKTNSVWKVVSFASKSDSHAFGHIQLQCISEGPAEASIFDSKNPDDSFELGGTSENTISCKKQQ